MTDKSSSIDQSIQGATLSEDTSSRILRILGLVILAVVIIALLIAPKYLGNYGLYQQPLLCRV